MEESEIIKDNSRTNILSKKNIERYATIAFPLIVIAIIVGAIILNNVTGQDIKIIHESMTSDWYDAQLEGEFQNVSSKDFYEVILIYDFYDFSGLKIGSDVCSVRYVFSGERQTFSCVVITDDSNSVAWYRLKKIITIELGERDAPLY